MQVQCREECFYLFAMRSRCIFRRGGCVGRLMVAVFENPVSLIHCLWPSVYLFFQ